jgi:hypothetical protein
VPKTLHRRVQVVLPVDLFADIDKLVGSAFLTEVARREVMIRQREALRDAAGPWKDQDNPELANRAADMVRENERLEQTRALNSKA